MSQLSYGITLSKLQHDITERGGIARGRTETLRIMSSLHYHYVTIPLLWCPKWESNPQNRDFETRMYTSSIIGATKNYFLAGSAFFSSFFAAGFLSSFFAAGAGAGADAAGFAGSAFFAGSAANDVKAKTDRSDAIRNFVIIVSP